MAAEPRPGRNRTEVLPNAIGVGLPGATGFPSLILKPRPPGSGLEDDHSEARGSFVGSVVDLVDGFYGDVLQKL
jgi:hypothetical protein